MVDGRPILLYRTDDQWQIYEGSGPLSFRSALLFTRLFLLKHHQQNLRAGSTNEHHPKGHFRWKASQAVIEITSCDYKHMSGRPLMVLVVRTELVTLPEPNFLLPENCLMQAPGMHGRTEHLD